MPINVVGPVCSTGYSVCLMNLLRSFDKLGAEPALFPIGQVDGEAWPNDHDLLRRSLGRASRFDARAASLRVWHQNDMAVSIGHGKRLGLTFTELDRLKPVEVHHLNSLDCVIQPSKWAASVAVKSGVTATQLVAPPSVDSNVFVAEEFPAGNTTVFVGAGKWEYRKGHDVLLHAFLRAFKPSDDVRLVMLCHNPFLNEVQHAEWHQYYKNSPLGNKIEIIPRRLPSSWDVAAVFRDTHCGVFPARAEGFNLEAAELLAMGRHCVMTDYGGHTEYLYEAGGIPIEIDRTEPAHDGIWFDRGDPAWKDTGPGEWAVLGECQLDDLSASMRDFHEDRLAGRAGLNEAGIQHFQTKSWESSAKSILEEAVR